MVIFQSKLLVYQRVPFKSREIQPTPVFASVSSLRFSALSNNRMKRTWPSAPKESEGIMGKPPKNFGDEVAMDQYLYHF